MISAIVLSAGLSSRMGKFKPLLQYGQNTVIEQIVSVLQEDPFFEILVVTGFNHRAIEVQLEKSSVTCVHNPNYRNGEMLSSIQAGLNEINPDSEAVLLALGDQPAIESSVVSEILTAFKDKRGTIIIPSYNMRRGHPMLLGRTHWEELIGLKETHTMRDFLANKNTIYHVNVKHSSILRDMDTMDDYKREILFLQESLSD